MLTLSLTRAALKDLRAQPAVDRLRGLDRPEAYAADPASLATTWFRLRA